MAEALADDVVELAGGAVLISGEHRTGSAPLCTTSPLGAMPDQMVQVIYDETIDAPGADVLCDRCPQNAAAVFTVCGSTLAFCGHHTAAYAESLAERGAVPVSADAERLWQLGLDGS